MRSLIMAHGIIVLTILATACADPTAPTFPDDYGRGTVARVARPTPTPPVSIPDSVGIPPSIPPIFEEAPTGFDTTQ